MIALNDLYGLRPKHRINPEFEHFVDENDKVMRENFAERFVDHRHVGLASQTVSEFTLHHGERGFDVGPFVIMREKIRPLELEIMVHLFPRPAAVTAMMGSERNKRRSSHAGDHIGIAAARIPLIGGDLRNSKILSSPLNQSRKHDGVVCVPSENFNRSYNVSFHSANQMALDRKRQRKHTVDRLNVLSPQAASIRRFGLMDPRWVNVET